MNINDIKNKISIGNRTLSENDPAFIVAEAACNHMCDIDIAMEMIDKAAEAGADAIKFQTYKAEKLVTPNAIAFWGDEKISQLEYYKRLDRFGKNDYKALFNYASKKGLICFSSPFDFESVDMLAELNMAVFKIASCEINNLEFLKYVSNIGKPIMLSTGASTEEEIDRAIDTILNEGNNRLMLLACTLSYPTKVKDANFLRIRALKDRYPGMIVGISDHTEPDPQMAIPSVAVALGAKIVEKHYTLDRTMTGSGHFFAVNPNDLRKMVNNIRIAEATLGNGALGVAESEKKALFSARRSIVAAKFIGQGEVIGLDMLSVKRPFDGLSADKMHMIIGRRAKNDIQNDQKIMPDMLD